VYTVYAVAEDKAGNRSALTVFHGIVDAVNFYLSAENQNAAAEQPPVSSTGQSFTSEDSPLVGSFMRPFTELEDALAAIAYRPNARLHISGEFTLLNTVTLRTPCSFVGGKNARIMLASDARLCVQDSDFSASEVIFERITASVSRFLVSAIDIQNGSGIFTNCTFTVSAQGSASVFSLTASKLELADCLVSLSTTQYADAVTGASSTVSVQDSVFVLDAPTAVCFSFEGGDFALHNSQVRITSAVGRVAELSSNATLRATKNRFVIDSDAPLWLDRTSTVAVFTENFRYLPDSGE
jgi:hypothetical protein